MGQFPNPQLLMESFEFGDPVTGQDLPPFQGDGGVTQPAKPSNTCLAKPCTSSVTSDAHVSLSGVGVAFPRLLVVPNIRGWWQPEIR